MFEPVIAVVEDESSGAPSTSSVSYVRIGSDKAQYDLFFTDRRIIAATVFSQSDISEVAPIAVYESAFKWKEIRAKNRESFKGRSPDEILNMHKDSYEIPYRKIRSARVKKKVFSAKLILEVEWQDSLEELDLKIPKKRVDEVKVILQNHVAGGVK